jgi:ATP-dependent helicase Lhr and Lhr-like helicase
MSSAFSRFPPRLQEAIVSSLGWSSLRPVQEMAGHAILDGKNVVVSAPTAGGKTEAAIFPVLATLIERPSTAVGALYIAPIRSLLNNQSERLEHYTGMVGLRRSVWHGDTAQSEKRDFLRDPVDLLMTTPESLEVMLISPRVHPAELFKDLRIIVIDEVHAFAGTDRGAHLMAVLERIQMFAPTDLQRVGLSATVGNPDEILRWLSGSSKRPSQVVNPPREPLRRAISIAFWPGLTEIANAAAQRALGHRSLLFCDSRALAEEISERMRGRGVEVFVHHSSVALEERRLAEARFSRGTNACIVCTSTLELGIDVGDLDYVLQVDAPATVSSFLQRMGRTGRRPGQIANTFFFCRDPFLALQAIAIVELAREGWVESSPVSARSWPVLVQQIFAQALQFGAVSPDRCWAAVCRVPDFAGISREEFDTLVSHMVAVDLLFEMGGLLAVGASAERQFGRKNFSAIYSVFSSPAAYRVKTGPGRDLGSIDQTFADSLVAGMTSFLLGGRAWLADAINHAEKTVAVRSAPKGKRPTWGSPQPQFLGRRLCRRMRRILTGVDTYEYVDLATLTQLQDLRSDLGETLRRNKLGWREEEGRKILWTFAGGRINSTLRYAFSIGWGIKCSADNFALRFSDGTDYSVCNDAFTTLARSDWWQSEDNLSAISRSIPNYRASKFQGALPPSLQSELLNMSFLDIKGAREFVADVSDNLACS